MFKCLMYFAVLVTAVSAFYEEGNADAVYVDDDLEEMMQNDGYSVKTGHRKKSKSFVFKGGCVNWPESPINGRIHCSGSECRANCKPDYRFPNGETQLSIICHDREWHISGTEWSAVPHCEPVCLPQCLNNGICISPNQCQCPEHFSGPQCQFENKPCLNQSPPVQNAIRRCNSKTCTVSCLEGFIFPDGSAVANLICKSGNWVPTRSDWVSIPDCTPVCTPLCQNGGICLALNTCQCPQDYRGPQCQYLAANCSPRGLGFNGGYKCTSNADSFTCTLSCPEGVDFTFPPATEYVCTYDKGIFEPHPLPQCDIRSDYQIIPIESSKNSYIKITNHSWIIEGSSVAELSHNFLKYNMTKMTKHSKAIKSHHYNGNEQLGENILPVYTKLDQTTVNVVEVKPAPKTCFTWGGSHYKSFDGAIYSFDSNCPYTLLQDTSDGIFTIIVQNSPGCRSGERCYKIIKIYLQGKEYTLDLNESGVPMFRTVKKILPIPTQLSNIRVVMSAHFIMVTLDTVGINLKWDGGLFVQLKASESLWNRTGGLCGKMNGDPNDDKIGREPHHHETTEGFAAEWKIQNFGEICDDFPNVKHSCDNDEVLRQEAIEFCQVLFSDPKFTNCSNVVDVRSLQTACQWDYCACRDVEKRQCACDTMSVYVRQCFHDQIAKTVAWRREDTCPMTCTGGRIYKSCGPKFQPSCTTDVDAQAPNEVDCEEGCFCPEGTVFHNGTCISVEECPCRLRGKIFKPGSTIPKDCNTCICTSGKWNCTQIGCGARCAAVGDPHYVTFDGKHYDFMGKCNYYLVKGDNYSIETENVVCMGAISEAMGYSRVDSVEGPSCTKSVTIRFPDIVIGLKQNNQVFVNDKEIKKFPVLIGGTKIRIASSIFLVVKLSNNLEIWWDGVSRVYVNVPAEFRGKTKGLCGTFSLNQKDDFLTPDGDVEQSVVDFANKWKTNEQCENIPKKDYTHPCDTNPERLAVAEKHCSKIWSELFSNCHWYVDPESFYRDCKYDMCACESNVERCFCPTFAAYARECAATGVNILWRTEIKECQLHCPAGQEYQICGNSCTRSCSDISFNEDCRQECVEGCNCPEGETLNAHGECIAVGQCPCVYNGIEFSAGYREIRAGTKSQDLCACSGGLWSCRPATPEEIREYSPVDVKTACSSLKNWESTTCEPAEPRTCKNMHEPVNQSPAICRSGCVCKAGYVLDSSSGHCVKYEDCPCYHGGKSYKENATMQEECNTCKCENRKWKCTDRICAGVCSAWGDSHFRTFDDKTYDFQGICDYILVKGSFGANDCFEVSTQNVPCGSSGVSCSKSITLTIGSGNNQEIITLIKDKPLPTGVFKRILIREAGIFVFLDVPDLGLVVQWDKGTRVYVKLNPKWKGRTKGLCGDYNDNSEDDFKTPSGGISEASARIFGDSWKKNNYCSEPMEVTDTCLLHPQRKVWAVEKCGILKSSHFQACHSEVDLEPYVERCIFDTCGCDAGGDCECLCTALAAYAYECNRRGVPIKWRSQELCPMQCDENCSAYTPCMSTCPRETCDNLLSLQDSARLCSEDTCVEGCLLKSCPDGQVYRNNSFTECVPRSTCKPICLEKEGILYYEGDKMSSDSCQTCFCSRGKVICNGAPCSTTGSPTIVPMEQSEKCISGWTGWLNKHSPKSQMTKGAKSVDIEHLPLMIDLLGLNESARCPTHRMVDIKCRTVAGHLTPKETGLDVECSLERGLYCQAAGNEIPCMDFEISVLCQCEDTTTVAPTTATSTVMQEECDINHPNQAHQTDCHIFYHCTPTFGGTKLVKKTCGEDMFYNPVTMTCDWPYNVAHLRPECGSTVESTLSPAELCKSGEKWNECVVQCNRTCEYYGYLLREQNLCSQFDDCIPGCVSEEKICPKKKFWRDAETCVDISDCNCKSYTGKSVKPGDVVEESECIHCQCLNNYYTCDESCPIVQTTTEQLFTPISTIKDNTIIIPTTVSPAEPCASGEYKSLQENVIFKASSASNSHLPENAKMQNSGIKSSMFRSWQPEYIDTEQWLEIELPQITPVYGVILQGSPEGDKYVTSYKILFSQDGNTFSYMPTLFQGPIDSQTPVRQIFQEPIEAKIVRINPQTWHHGIAVRVDVLGCQDPVIEHTTASQKSSHVPVYEEKTERPICDEPMGLTDGLLVEEQVIASSTLDSLIPNLQLSSSGIWRPKLDNPSQYVEFNFLGNRNITGIETKGANNIWTTAYKVFYGNDGHHWNPVIDSSGAEKIFLANFDDITPKINYFDRAINAQYLRIQPVKWHQHVGLKVEIHGCFIPYPVTPARPPKLQVIEAPCNVCHDIFHDVDSTCKCQNSLWWDGKACVEKQYCPCIVGSIPYDVGTIFETTDCKKCMCTIGGSPDCQMKICEPCSEPNMRSTVTELCGCVCKPCAEGTRLCPTSNICINETLWCNGVNDCPDDESNCVTIPPPLTNQHIHTNTTYEIITTEIKNVTSIQCETPVCPAGYKLTPVRKSTVNKPPPPFPGAVKGRTKGMNKLGAVKGRQRIAKEPRKTLTNVKEADVQVTCDQFSCVPVKAPPILGGPKGPAECPKVECPTNYHVVFEPQSMYKPTPCPKYNCLPPPPVEFTCNVTGRTFNTFDGLEYKYDICNHILARDMYFNKWYITLEKHCSKLHHHCSQVLAIVIDNDVIVLYSDMHVDINEYTFTPKQIKHFANKRAAFKIAHIGNILHFISNKYGFWIIWDQNANVKVGLTAKLSKRVDGLCGYFDGIAANDRQKPDGNAAKTSEDFGNSWAMDDTPECDTQGCSKQTYDLAREICQSLMDASFVACTNVLSVEKFTSQCMESTCTCINSNMTNEECRCRALTTFATDCQAADENIDLSTWRSIHNCPAHCPAPFIYKDCFRNKCEISCETLQDIEPCPRMHGVCFPGCFCPEGMVRSGEDCVPPTECRDCVCDGYGNSNFVTFDRKNFTFAGNCTYVLSQDVAEKPIKTVKGTVEEDHHTYQILLTNIPCQKGVCTESLSITYRGHFLEIQQDAYKKSVLLMQDGEPIDQLPYENSWLRLETISNEDVKLLISAIQLELTVFRRNFAFNLRLPSHIFGGAVEGLCGDCNANTDDDFKKRDGEITENVNEFAISWLATGVPSARILSGEDCVSQPVVKCTPPSPQEDPCMSLLNPETFGQCHNLVDPMPYIDSCHDTFCEKGDICTDLEAYARACRESGLCPNWRTYDMCPYTCRQGLEYQPCGPSCPETCETLTATNKPKCSQTLTEGCFCPEHHVYHNNTCVAESNCYICDDQGHIDGDVWHPDKCTTCSCSKKIVNCQTTECPILSTLCEENFTPIQVQSSEEACCSKYSCVPVPTVAPTCPETQPLECAYGQVMKLIKDSANCPKFICQCLPPEECPLPETLANEALPPGFVEIINSTGCCPRAVQICKPETCPPPQICPDYYAVQTKDNPEACCPTYVCEIPNDICLYSPENANDENSRVSPRKIGEVWKDGLCKECKCEKSLDKPQYHCTKIECNEVNIHVDYHDFVLEPKYGGNCCPQFERIACKDHEVIYEVGKEWYPDSSNVCVVAKCGNSTNGIQKSIVQQECNTTCDLGYEYRLPNDSGLRCCGECVPVACIINDTVRSIGEEWESDDFCTRYTCFLDNGMVRVKESVTVCEKINPVEQKDFEIRLEYLLGVCCPKYHRTACKSGGNIYEVGDTWQTLNDTCITKQCVSESERIEVKEVHQSCNKTCDFGWDYQQPEQGACCGQCKQAYCVVEGQLYRPGATWYSENNCTKHECEYKNGQIVVISSTTVCPDIIDCPAENVYFKNCCQKCRATIQNQEMNCAAEVLEADSTVGIVSHHEESHGFCRNTGAIQGYTECRGICKSRIDFDTITWHQQSHCQCCQPKEFKNIDVNLTCEDGRQFTKKIFVPISCSCEYCKASSIPRPTKGQQKAVKG